MRFDDRGYRLSVLALIPLLLVSSYLERTFKFLIPSVLIAFFILWFHRDPDREIPSAGLTSPVDGKVKNIRETDDGIVEVSIYLGLSDVHIARSPKQGYIENIYRKGEGNFPALLSRSKKNNSLVFSYESGMEVSIMTGVIARRLQSKISTEAVSKGERIGLISFGSRSILRYQSDNYDLTISEGDKVTAGETIIGK